MSKAGHRTKTGNDGTDDRHGRLRKAGQSMASEPETVPNNAYPLQELAALLGTVYLRQRLRQIARK